MRKFLLTLLLTSTLSLNKLELIDGFPIWLKDGDKNSDQTSGITFIGEKNGKKYFLICDDIGKIHRISINDTKLKIETIKFDDSVDKFLKNFEKEDFEEIVYDKQTNQVFISIEGNGPDFKQEVGIYKVKFKNDDVFSDEIVKIEKVNFNDWDEITKYTSNNIGFEGVGVSDTKFFLGLEGFQFGDLFLDSTLIYVIDKNSKQLIKKVSTKNLQIHTICGLYAVDDYHIFGIDRNQQNLFEIKFKKNYDVEYSNIVKLDLPVPKKRDLKYVASIESITFDNENYVYVIDDPWKKFYVPPSYILEQLSEKDVENFKKFIPLLFKYKLN